jgi:hypothetical protein
MEQKGLLMFSHNPYLRQYICRLMRLSGMHDKIADMTGMHHARAVKGTNFEHDPHGYGPGNPLHKVEEEAEKIGKHKMKF